MAKLKFIPMPMSLDEDIDGYMAPGGWRLKREAEWGEAWVLRHNGKYIDKDQYRNDILERHDGEFVRIDDEDDASQLTRYTLEDMSQL